MELTLFIVSFAVKNLIRADTVLILTLLACCAFFYWGRERWGRRLLWFSTIMLLVFSIFPLGDLLMGPLERSFPANPPLSDVNGIVVLGGAEREWESAYWGQPLTSEAGERYIGAIHLANRFPTAKVIFAGGFGWPPDSPATEAQVAAKIFSGAGIPENRVLLEDKSRNTFENARNAMAIAGPPEQGPWVLITSAGHMPRALGSFCAAGWRNIVPWPTDFQTADFADHIGWNLFGNLFVFSSALKEWVGLVGYRILGRTDSILPASC
jgi:uncharacterized SAM-binding protein YcdF (DUF218 family)